MRKLLICSILPLLVAATACASDASSSPSAVESNSLAPTTAAGSTGSNPTDGTSGTATPGTATPGTATIDWSAVAGLDGVEEGTLAVPIDYEDPSKGNFTLYMERHLAEKPNERIGTLLVNPGGPGYPGVSLAEHATAIYGQDVLDRFDILAWDPRGVGQTTPAVDCVTDYDHFFDNSDITPDTPAEKQQIVDLAKEFTDDCVTKNPKIIDFVGTNDSARDMDSIRKALGEQKISYFGFSYGSELGATWATLFPDTVRAAVLDGAVDPNADLVEGGLQQIKGFEASLDTFLQQCSADRTCPFNNGGHADTAFDQLMAAIDQHPLPGKEGRPPLERVAALSGVSEAMYSNASWPQLAQALADAQGGDGSGLMELYDEYYQRHPDGTYDNSLEAFNVILCMSQADRPTVAEEDANAPKFTAVAPRLSPGDVGSYQCTFYPPTTDPRVPITGKGAGPIVVVGTTGDPATPLEGTRNMAKALEGGVLLVVDGEQHTGYGVNACSIQTVDSYLLDPVNDVPKDGTECK
ncbi:MAG: peptidase family protein [Ilumatobacteraceae bacterium]|nr:peptidase family protein [Ilumatobacteraceae bacterium]